MYYNLIYVLYNPPNFVYCCMSLYPLGYMQWKTGLPIEVLSFAYKPVKLQIERAHGGVAELRLAKNKAVRLGTCGKSMSGWLGHDNFAETLPRSTIQTFQQHYGCLRQWLKSVTDEGSRSAAGMFELSFDWLDQCFRWRYHDLLHTCTWLGHTYSTYWWGEWTYIRTNLCKPIISSYQM